MEGDINTDGELYTGTFVCISMVITYIAISLTVFKKLGIIIKIKSPRDLFGGNGNQTSGY